MKVSINLFKYHYANKLLKLSIASVFCALIISASFSITQAQTPTTQDSAAVVAAVPAAPSADPALVQLGKSLFEGNCTVCHKINEKYVGPALRDVHVRRPIEWIQRFVRNSQQVIESGDPYAVALYAEYKQTQMTAFDFSSEEIDAVVAYIIDESAKPLPVAEQLAVVGAGGGGVSSEELTYVWIGIVAVLVLVLLVVAVLAAVLRAAVLQTNVNEQDKEDIGPGDTLKRLLKSNTVAAIVVFLFTAVLFKTAIDGLYTIGVQQGYSPKQPIAFSHQLHAGQYEIDCNYCHTGAYKGKSAGIPSANICMNCHGEIKTESKEIQKIARALDKNQPIEWVRVHNLPDLAYFNHSQHTQVGGVACQTCHGPIEEMPVVRQHAPLTMGWCINCHKTTQIQAQDNAYYDKLIQLHDDPSALRVEDNWWLRMR